ncbi:Transcriptional regulator HilA [Ensifer psoraleae]|uniref:winged helix-turn-helix domain-containing protein n=1 Tax=Sinorhizobium psoraleae TaxID=520838 RepID=UPI001AEEF114|nr:winged helix-turn-helix domain-containing protein [Sinorhizobium psoraleae]NRP70585.1 Transcriptional regulator HilA [Sinorhizobium psoraleae]
MDVRLPDAFTFNGVTADFRVGLLHDGQGRDVMLRPQAFAVLTYLADHAGRVVTKDELIEAVWGRVAVTDDSLVQCIADIRRAFGDNAHAVIRTVPKRGYMLSVSQAEAAGVPPKRWRWKAAVAAICLAMIAAVAGWPLLRPDRYDAQRSRVPSVAVLPFNSIGDEAAQRLADGLTEDIITDLARFPEYAVIGSNSTAIYKGKAVDPREVAAALHVGYVIEGSIQREAGRTRIAARLIDAASGEDIWSNRWDQPDRDIFAVQNEIAEQIANRLGGGAGLIQEAGRNAARRKPPENLSAYELYLLGTEKLELFTKSDVEEAIRLLTRAVEIDPGLARAWAELFHSYCVWRSFGADWDTATRKADEAAEMAVRLDPGDPEAHAVLGMSLGGRGDFVRAKAEFDTALRLAPGAAEILIFYIGLASTLGEAERGAELIEQAIRLDPNYPMWASGPFAYAYFMAGRYEDSLRMLDRVTTANYNRDKWVFKAGSLAALGRTAEAKSWVEQALKVFPDLNAELMNNDPGYNEAEHRRLVETMRLAGFPLCLTKEQLDKFEKPRRLPECQKS